MWIGAGLRPRLRISMRKNNQYWDKYKDRDKDKYKVKDKVKVVCLSILIQY